MSDDDIITTLIVNSKLKLTADQWTEVRELLRAGIKKHSEHVSTFLTELYSVMVDPLAEGNIPVNEMCDKLLEQAHKDREALSKVYHT